MRANSDPSTDADSRTCPPLARTTATSFSANSGSPLSRATDRAGNRRGRHWPWLYRSSERIRSSTVMLASAPRLPQATPSTGRPETAPARRAASVVPSPPIETIRSTSAISPFLAIGRCGYAVATWTTSIPCCSVHSRIRRTGSSTFRVGWTRTPMRSGRSLARTAVLACGRDVDIVARANDIGGSSGGLSKLELNDGTAQRCVADPGCAGR